MSRDFLRFDLNVHSIRAGDRIVYVCNPNPEGEYVLWSDVAPYIEEERSAGLQPTAQQGTPLSKPNSAMLKLLCDTKGYLRTYGNMGPDAAKDFIERVDAVVAQLQQ